MPMSKLWKEQPSTVSPYCSCSRAEGPTPVDMSMAVPMVSVPRFCMNSQLRITVPWGPSLFKAMTPPPLVESVNTQFSTVKASATSVEL